MYYEMFTYFYSCINWYKKFVLQNYTYLLSKYLRPKTHNLIPAVQQYNGNKQDGLGFTHQNKQI